MATTKEKKSRKKPMAPKAVAAPSHRSPFWFSFFLPLLVLFPLPFGGNRPWASDLFAVLIGVLLILFLWKEHHAPDPFLTKETGDPPRKRLFASAVGFLLVLLWSFVQITPWTPSSWHHPLWREAIPLLGDIKGSISIDTGLFSESLVRFTSFLGCFILAFHASRDRERALTLVKWLSYAGFGYALYGLFAQASGSDSILWYKKWAYEGFLTSTFVNKNSYAAYAGLGLLCCLAWLHEQIKKIKPRDVALAKRARVIALISSLQLKDYALFLPPLVLLGALALTGSRAGIFSTFIGILVFAFSLAVHNRLHIKQWLWLLGLGCGFFFFFVTLGGEALLTRLDQDKMGQDTDLRLAGYALSQEALSDNAWLGFGLGTFDGAFQLYRDETMPLWLHHAHNDYIEMAMDLGLPAAIILFVSIGLLVSCCLSGLWVRRRDGLFPALALGATGLIGTHALFDFSLHIPAIAATYASLLALGVAQSWSSRPKS